VSPFQSSAVDVRLTALYAEVPKRGPVVRNLVRINAADLTWKHDDHGNDWAQILLLAVALARATSRWRGSAASSIYGWRPESWPRRCGMALVHTGRAGSEARAYQVRVAVRDQTTAKIGSATQFLQIPDLKKRGFALASVILLDAEPSPDKSNLPASWRRCGSSSAGLGRVSLRGRERPQEKGGCGSGHAGARSARRQGSVLGAGPADRRARQRASGGRCAETGMP